MKYNNEKLIILIGVLLTLFSQKTMSQQLSADGLYIFNRTVINPAIVGADDSFTVILNHREQWLGFEGKPQTNSLSVYAPLKYRLGGGLSVTQDKLGAKSFSSIMVDLAYKVKINDNDTYLSFGIKPGISIFQTDYENNIDPLAQNQKGVIKFNSSIGSILYSKQYYIGVSVRSLVNSFISDNVYGDFDSEVRYSLNMGYLFDLNRNIKLKPGFSVETNMESSYNLNLSGNLIWNEDYWVGLTYLYARGIGANLKFKLFDKLIFGCAYGYALNNSKHYSRGSYELMLSYKISPAKIKTALKYF